MEDDSNKVGPQLTQTEEPEVLDDQRAQKVWTPATAMPNLLTGEA